ncbi:MAG: hypothetical protein GXC72_00790 [Chitinophagaceae bacterium]|nr:hypothetical protein [Chitinophagaceae bacterium]
MPSRGNKGKSSDDLVMEERTRTVIQWVLKGYFTKDIIYQAKLSWQVEERQAYNYLKRAKGEIKKIRSKDLKDLIAWHQGVRMQLYNQLENKKSPSGTCAAMEVLKDMAKIDGVYPADKHEVKLDAETVVVVGSKQLSKE